MIFRIVCLVCLLPLTVVVGCGRGPELATVSGLVTVDGKPVPNAMITFFPEFSGTTSYGVTDPNGKYVLMFTDQDRGALIGSFRVSITTKKRSKDEMPDDGSVSEVVFVEIPKQYRGEKAHKAEVKSGSNKIDFAMLSK